MSITRNNLKNAPMSSAPFVYDDAGRVAWNKMWNTFCYLAVEGGPPHRETKLVGRGNKNDTSQKLYTEAVSEIIRAYKLLIPCTVRHDSTGWIAITLHTPNMAKWFETIINEENVECRREGKTLFLPVNDDYTLEKEIKNVVTVMTKAYHYWRDHRVIVEKLLIMLFNYDIQWELIDENKSK